MRIRRMRGKYFKRIWKIRRMQGCLRCRKSSPNMRKVLPVFREYADRIYAYLEKSLCACSLTTPRGIKLFKSQLIIIRILKFCLILSIYTKWDGLSQKTISRYCSCTTLKIVQYIFFISFYIFLSCGFSLKVRYLKGSQLSDEYLLQNCNLEDL